mgnify:CR=1 FL=1
MPWSVDDPPPPATNWPKEDRRKFRRTIFHAARKAAQAVGKGPAEQAEAARRAVERYAQLQESAGDGGGESSGGADGFLSFDEAIYAARDRGVVLPDVYYGELRGVARQAAFSIAGEGRMAQLEQALGELQRTMAEGGTLRDFQRRVTQGEAPLELPRHRIENILRTNTQGAFARGRCVHNERHRDTRPYLRYSAVNDSRTRESHAAMHGTVARQDDPIWSRWMPPNGYQCRCTVTSLTERQAERYIDRDERRQEDRDFRERRAQALQDGPDAGWDYSPCEEPDAGMGAALERYGVTMPKPIAQQAERITQQAQEAGYQRSSKWERVADKEGSVPGGIYEAPDGRRYIAKFYSDPEQARAEVASQRIHELLGVETSRGHITQLPDSDGNMRTVVANEVRDDLTVPGRELADVAASKPRDAARLFHASVITGNRDAVGMEYDNVAVTGDGRLAQIDTGGSLLWRAQGQRKDFGPDAPELQGLRDPKINPQAAEVFGRLEREDAWWEATGASKLLDVRKGDYQHAFEDAGFDPDRVKELTETAWARHKLLIERYDADRKRRYKGFGKHEQAFKRMFGTGRFEGAERTDTGHFYGTYKPEEMAKIQQGFREYVRREVGDEAAEKVERLYSEWSRSSDMPAGAAMKFWAMTRFGISARYHDGKTGEKADFAAKQSAGRFFRKQMDRDEALKLFDIEHEFSVYLARRANGYDPFTVSRFMSKAELESGMNKAGDSFLTNAAISTTQKPTSGFSGARKVELEVRAEDVIKVWWQGKDFMHFGDREAEFILHGGRRRPAREVEPR